MIKGKVEGIKKHLLNMLEEIYDMTVEREQLISLEIIEVMNEVTLAINKEISVAVNRKGKVINVAVGDSRTVELPHVEVGEEKLSGVRIIHTHPNGDSRLSRLDISALQELQLDAMVAIGVKEKVQDIKLNAAFIQVMDGRLTHKEIGYIPVNRLDSIDIIDKVNQINRDMKDIQKKDEDQLTAILVGLKDVDSLEELQGLAEACGVKPVEKVVQKRNKIDSAYYTGKGKVQELAHIRQITKADMIIFDDELSPSQVRNLTNEIGCKIIDRTALILEIFNERAKTKAARLQVELATLKHSLTRLRGFGADMDKVRGGVGVKSRGAGEKKLELDRRRIAERIDFIKAELQKIVKLRDVQKNRRSKENISNVSLVGYTNAGKSTLRNKLCQVAAAEYTSKEGVMEADMLFATLDTTIRAVKLQDNRRITLSDTVGFIKKLPHELVESFKSTLEEVVDADLLLHVVDASNEEALSQIEAVNSVLDEIGAGEKNTIMVLNKIDSADEEVLEEIREALKGQKIIEVSAIKNMNLDKLMEVIGDEIPQQYYEKEFIIPYSDSAVVSLLHDKCNVLESEYKEEGTYIRAEVYEEIYNRCSEYELRG